MGCCTALCPSWSEIVACPANIIGCAAKPINIALDAIRSANERVENLPLLGKLAVRITVGFAIGYFLMPMVSIVIAVAVTALIGFDKMAKLQKEAPLYKGEMPSAFALCIVAPVFEEVVFRGMIQPVVKKGVNFVASCCFAEATARKISVVVAVIFTSSLFGLAHMTNSANPIVALPQVAVTTFGGIVMGLMKESGNLADDGPECCDNAWTKGMATCTATHIGNNSFVATIIYLAGK